MSKYDQTEAITAEVFAAHFDPKKKVQTPPCLILIDGPQDILGKQWVINADGLTLGRIEPAEIHIEDKSISKAHAQFLIKENKVFVTDLGSTNKTLIDGNALEPNCPKELKNNDKIVAGKLIFKFLANGLISETNEKDRMQGELETAQKIQSSLYPESPQGQMNGLTITGSHQSASECCGDWWYYWMNEKKAYVIVADATGHGASAALVTVAARTAISAIEDNFEIGITGVYKALNRAIQSATSGNSMMSGYVLEIDLEKKEWSYINASHPLGYLLPTDSIDLRWNKLPSLDGNPSHPLGTDNPEFEIITQPIANNNRIVLYTDGIVERENTSGKHANDREFNSMLIEAHTSNPSDPQAFLDRLIQLSNIWASDGELEDDITVVAIDFSA